MPEGLLRCRLGEVLLAGEPRLALQFATVDPSTGHVQRRDGATASLTPTERALLAYLADRPGQPVGRDVLLGAVWGYRPGVRSRALDTAIKELRRKVERDPAQPDHLQTVRGLGYRFDPAPPAGAAPAGPGPMFGRSAEARALADLVDRGARIVVLRGPGGVGKTRLAREVLGDRCRWVDLTPATTAEDVIEAVSRAVSAGPGERHDLAGSDADRLSERLRAGRVGALCLDNCEGAAEAVRVLVERWVAAVPGLTVVLTSRVGIGAGEELLLGPLPDGDAVALLVDRATRRRPAFGQADPQVLRDIARRVDGLPLALELVAARAVLLDAEALLQRLVSVSWLAQGAADPRHASLTAVVDWSWELLDPPTREVLAACTVFPGTFEVGAAEAVAGPGALTALEQLADASLAYPEADGRLALWAMVREAAARHLPDREVPLARLADWLVAELAGAPVRRVCAEADDLRVALRASVGRRDDVAVDLALLLDQALASSGPMRARLEVLQTAIECAERAGDRQRRARALLARARARDVVGAGGIDEDLAAARACAADPATLGDVWLQTGTIALNRGDLDRAERAYREAIPGLEAAGARGRLADAWSNLGHVALLRGRHDEALDTLKRGLALQEEAGNDVNAAKVLGTIGMVYEQTGNIERAARFWRQALDRHQAAGHRPGVLRMVGNLSLVDHTLGRLADAAAGFEAAARLARELGEPLIEALAYLNGAAVALEQGDEARAEATLARSRVLLEQRSARLYLGRVALWEGVVAVKAGEPAIAARRLAESDALLLEVGDRPTWLQGRGFAVAALGLDHDLAALADEARDLHGTAEWLAVARALRDARSAAEGARALEALRAFAVRFERETSLRVMARVVLAASELGR